MFYVFFIFNFFVIFVVFIYTRLYTALFSPFLQFFPIA